MPVDEYAHDGEPWVKDYFREELAAGHTPDLLLGARNPRSRGRYLNVTDGRRATWTPRDPDLTVWFFGGSTTYGIGQRDNHTIPSVFAKAASKDGVGIRALNFGVSGDVNWIETLRFAEALTTPGLPRPDLAVFYDGANDYGLGVERAQFGATDPTESMRLTLSDSERQQAEAALGEASDAKETVDAIALVVAQYRRGVAASRDLGASAGVSVVHVWQPSPFAMRARPEDDELYRRMHFDPQLLPVTREQYERIRTDSQVEPIDLTQVFDHLAEPVFFDSSHTNERGARIVGEELFRRLEPTLRDLAQHHVPAGTTSAGDHR